MKKILYILLGIMALAASTACNKADEPQDTAGETKTVTINVAIDEPNASRAIAAPTRFCLEMYEFSIGATPEKFNNTTGIFDVKMKKGAKYILLFWADDATSYSVYNLKSISPVSNDKITPAYFAALTVKTEDFDGAVTLKRAVTEINFIETAGFTAAGNSLTVTYPFKGSSFNMYDGTVTRTSGTVVKNFTDIPATAANGVIATDYILAPTTPTVLENVKFQFNDLTEVVLDKITVQANYKTNIKGEFKK